MQKNIVIEKRKIWLLTIIGIMFLIMIPFGIKAFAQDSKCDIDNVKDNECTINVACDASLVEFVKAKGFDDKGMKVSPNSTVDFVTTENGIGYLYLTEYGSSNKNLIASAYPKEGYKFIGWEARTYLGTPEKLKKPYVITTDVVFVAKTQAVPLSDGGTFQGRIVEEKGVPVSDAWAYFKPIDSGEYYTAQTDINGYYRIAGVPLDVKGALNVWKQGYVVDYSGTVSLTKDNAFVQVPTTSLLKGLITNLLSNSNAKTFHIKKYYSRVVYPPNPQLAEEFDVVKLENESLPANAVLRVLTDKECEQLKCRYNTLCYSYVFSGEGAGRYVMYIEPNDDTAIDSWKYSSKSVKDANLPKTDKEEEAIKLVSGEEPYTLKLNYDIPIPVDPSSGDASSVVPGSESSLAQTDDTNHNLTFILLSALFVCIVTLLVCNKKARFNK